MSECDHRNAPLDTINGKLSCPCGLSKKLTPKDYPHAAALTLSDEAVNAFLDVFPLPRPPSTGGER